MRPEAACRASLALTLRPASVYGPEFSEELTDYLDGAIDTRTRSELEEHLLWCHNCNVICDTAKQTIQIYRDAQPYDLPESLRTRLQKAILSKCKCMKPAKPKRKRAWAK